MNTNGDLDPGAPPDDGPKEVLTPPIELYSTDRVAEFGEQEGELDRVLPGEADSIERIDPALFQENERTAPIADQRRYVDVGALECELGGHIPSVTVAYETWGELNAAKDNAVLLCHALSGDSHAIGWWDRLVGPGKCFDMERYFVIGSNCLGGCQGSTGPLSLSPDGRPWATKFPLITIRDMVEVQIRLIRSLGIESLLCVAGGSMGGMQAIEWTLRGSVRKCFVTGSCAAHNAMQIGFNEAARQAVMRDLRWRGGLYPRDDQPDGGLAVARMIGHISFLSEWAFDQKFGRRLQENPSPDSSEETSSEPGPSARETRRVVGDDGKIGAQFQVESYLNYQGDKFTKRFDANSLLYLTKAIDLYDCRSLEGSTSEYLFVSFTSDWLYPPHQAEELHRMAQEAGCESTWENIDLPYGHDAFLLDGEKQGAALRAFLAG